MNLALLPVVLAANLDFVGGLSPHLGMGSRSCVCLCFPGCVNLPCYAVFQGEVISPFKARIPRLIQMHGWNIISQVTTFPRLWTKIQVC